MTSYQIEGADRTTGKERSCVLDAADEKSAARLAASDYGLFVSKIIALPPPKIDTPSAQPWVATEVPTVAGAERPRTLEEILSGVAMGIVGFALLAMAIGILFFAAIDVYSSATSKTEIGQGLSFRFALSGLSSGFMLLGLGAICVRMSRMKT